MRTMNETREESYRVRVKANEKWSFDHACAGQKTEKLDVIRMLMGAFVEAEKYCRGKKEVVIKFPFELKLVATQEVERDGN
ncbi:MAG TPA: hypothetical protein DCY07_04260 [Rhodospirillaceae bacterium]|nr:hypothetical protein [Rhodospirillaceae bacterium]